MPAEDCHLIKLYVSDDWCAEYSYATNTIHICDKTPGHGWEHECVHGDSCGYKWVTIEGEEPPKLSVRHGFVWDVKGKLVGKV